MVIVLKVPTGDECAPWVDNSDFRHSCGVYYYEKLQCRLILHTVSALGPRNHGVASYC